MVAELEALRKLAGLAAQPLCATGQWERLQLRVLAEAHVITEGRFCCRSTGVRVGEMPAGLLVSRLFLVSARGCSMLRLGRDVYRWLPCRLMVGAAARSMGLRLRSRGSFRQSPLAVLLRWGAKMRLILEAWSPSQSRSSSPGSTLNFLLLGLMGGGPVR